MIDKIKSKIVATVSAFILIIEGVKLMSNETKSKIVTLSIAFSILGGITAFEFYKQKELEKRTYNVETTVEFKVIDKKTIYGKNNARRGVYLRYDNLDTLYESYDLYWNTEIGDLVSLKAKLYYDKSTGDLVKIQIKKR